MTEDALETDVEADVPDVDADADDADEEEGGGCCWICCCQAWAGIQGTWGWDVDLVLAGLYAGLYCHQPFCHCCGLTATPAGIGGAPG